MIGKTETVGSIGVFSVSSKFGDVADAVQNYVDRAYSPWLFEKIKSKEENYKASIRKLANTLTTLIGMAFLCICFYSQDYILLFINSDYNTAWRYIALIVFIYAIKTIYYFFVEVLFYYKRAARILFIATITGSLCNILLSTIFIPVYGVMGAIIASALSMVTRVTIVVFISKRYDDIGLAVFDFVKKILLIIAFVSIGLLPSLITNIKIFTLSNFLFKSFIVLVYCIIGYINNKNEIHNLYVKLNTRCCIKE